MRAYFAAAADGTNCPMWAVMLPQDPGPRQDGGAAGNALEAMMHVKLIHLALIHVVLEGRGLGMLYLQLANFCK